MFVFPSGGGSDYEIKRSLRFNSADSAYLSRTLGTPANNAVWTWSGWIKRSALSAVYRLISATDGSVYNRTFINFCNASNVIEYVHVLSGVAQWQITSSRVFRDVASHCHIVINVQTSHATATERFKMWVNNEQVSFSGNPPQSTTSYLNKSSINHTIMAEPVAGTYSDGYLSETYFIDGQALDPSYFGYTDPNTHQWKPKAYTGSYGTNGFYLDFSDNTSTTTLGYDRSGNGNHWTLNNFSVAEGANNDSLLDTPTNNFATLNPLNQFGINGGAGVLSNGSLTFSISTTNYYSYIPSSMAIPTTGKWLAEFTPTALATGDAYGDSSYGVTAVNTSSAFPSIHAYFANTSGINGTLKKNGTTVQSVGSIGVGQVVGVAFDADNNSIQFYVGGAAVGSPITGLSSAEYQFFCQIRATSPVATTTIQANFGQRPFSYPVDGAKALCTKNLPTPTGAAARPWEHFDINLATGANIKSACEDDFTYFMEWIKDRGNANNHQLIDTVRGTSAALQSNTKAAETTYLAPSGSSVGWVFNAGGSAVANTDGSITSQVSANILAGFSIVGFNCNGVAGSTVGHGLGIVPAMIITKLRTYGSSNWTVYHKDMSATPQNGGLNLNMTSGYGVHADPWNNTAPTSSVIALGGGVGSAYTTNYNGYPAIMYCFAEIPGFSKIGSYTGNSSADGPFVYCGFRPAWILIKCAGGDGTQPWIIFDTIRSNYNLTDERLLPNTSAAEAQDNGIDIVSNGFKVRSNNTATNYSGQQMVFMAFAEMPFKYSNAR